MLGHDKLENYELLTCLQQEHLNNPADVCLRGVQVQSNQPLDTIVHKTTRN